MDMKASDELTDLLAYEGVNGIYYAILYGVLSFMLVIVALFLLYVACSKRYRLNWFERNLLETAENSELTTSHDALMNVVSDGDRRASRALLRDNSECWIPVGKAAQETADTSEEESETAGSPNTSRGSKTSLALDSVRNSGDETSSGAQPIARNDKHVVIAATPPLKPLVSMNTRLDFTKIDATLYEVPTEPEVPKTEEIDRGQVHILLSYDPVAGMLSLRLVEAKGLLPKDYSGNIDPYAKIRLLPDRSNVWQTRIHKKTLSPVFDEDFVFEVRQNTLARRILEIILYDFDAYSRHQSIGELKLPLGDLDLAVKLNLWKPLSSCSEQDNKAELGDVMVSLSFLQSAERLTVVVLKARNLRIVDDTRLSSDPFVKVTLLHGGKRLKKKKTSIHRNTLNPTFNERLTFDVSKDILGKCCLEFCVYHDAKLGPCELLGRSLVGGTSSCRPEDRQFFQELITSKAAHARWLMLTDPR